MKKSKAVKKDNLAKTCPRLESKVKKSINIHIIKNFLSHRYIHTHQPPTDGVKCLFF